MRLFWYQVKATNKPQNFSSQPLICIAIMQNIFWMLTTFQAAVAARLQRRQLWAAGPGPGGWWQMCRGEDWGELGSGYKRISYSRWIHYADINEIWIPNQTFYWIPLKTTKFDLLSLKLSAHLRVVKDATNSSLTSQWLHCRNICRLSLEVMTLNPICENVETAQGVPLTVTGVAQVSSNSQFW